MTGPETPFVAAYCATLERHVRTPGEAGLRDAYELGREALRTGTTLLQLVEAHLAAQRALAVVSPTTRQDAADGFLGEALAAYEVAQRGFAEIQESVHAERVRGALLNDLTSAYLAVAAGVTSSERCEEAVRQVVLLLDAVDASVELGRPHDAHPRVDPDAIVAPLPGAAGRLVAVGAPGRTWTEDDRAVLAQLAVLVHGPIIDARLLEFAERLERVGALLGSESDPEAIVDRLLDDGLDQTTAAFGAILLLESGVLRVAGTQVGGSRLVDERIDLDERSPIARVARSGVPLFLPDEAAIDRSIDDGGLGRPEPSTSAWAVVPLPGRRGPIGVFELCFEDTQSFDVAQRSFLAQVGERLATALERGFTFAAEREARRQAEHATERVSDLRELAAELSNATTRRGVAGVLLRHATALTGAAGGAVAVGGRRNGDDELLATTGGSRDGRAALDIPADAAGAVAACSSYEGDVQLADLPATTTERLLAAGLDSVVLCPVMAGSRQVGGVVLGWTGGDVPTFDRDDLRTALSMAGPALRRAGRYDIDHEIAVTLQRSLLTVPNVEIPGVTWAARYRSGSPGVAGGDWYDIIALEGQRVAVVIGDIVGKGVQAAAAMGQLRSATRALANRLDDPGQLVAALDDYVRTTGQGLFSSLALVVLDPADGTARHIVAGHPPPLLCTQEKKVSPIETGRGPLLGVGAERSVATVQVAPGDLLVLYTDGLIERRDRSLSDGLEVLITAVEAGIMEPTQLCRSVMETLADDRAGDDMAILAVQLARD